MEIVDEDRRSCSQFLGFVHVMDDHNAAHAGLDFGLVIAWSITLANELWKDHATRIEINTGGAPANVVTREGE